MRHPDQKALHRSGILSRQLGEIDLDLGSVEAIENAAGRDNANRSPIVHLFLPLAGHQEITMA